MDGRAWTGQKLLLLLRRHPTNIVIRHGALRPLQYGSLLCSVCLGFCMLAGWLPFFFFSPHHTSINSNITSSFPPPYSLVVALRLSRHPIKLLVVVYY